MLGVKQKKTKVFEAKLVSVYISYLSYWKMTVFWCSHITPADQPSFPAQHGRTIYRFFLDKIKYEKFRFK